MANLSHRMFALLVCSAALPIVSPAATISISAGSNWTVTAGGTGAVNVTPFVFGNQISVSSDKSAAGTFVTGGSAAAFDNFWTAQFTFFLPTNAINVSLTFGNFSVDDRAVLRLNGTDIGANGIGGPSSGCALGSMVLTDGGPNNPYNFCASATSGTVTSGFNLGGTNTLMAIINNTNSGIVGNLASTFANGGPTVFGVTGSVTFSQLPEPGSMSLLGSGLLAGMALWARRRHPNSTAMMLLRSRI